MLIALKPLKLSSCYVATLFSARTSNVVSKSLKIEYHYVNIKCLP